jgi:hypothetical protein
MRYRYCNADLTLLLIDLSSTSPPDACLTAQSLQDSEKWFLLQGLVCTNCWLVQTEDFTEDTELLDANYAYFSSFSTTWFANAKRYVSVVIERFKLSAESNVGEVAVNDSYLL